MQTIGVELEGTFVDANGRLADTLACIGGKSRTTAWLFEQLTTDMAASSFEMVTTKCVSGLEVKNSLARVQILFPTYLVPLFEPRPFSGDVRLADKSRMRAMQQALEQTKPGGSVGVQRVANWNSLQFHIGTEGLNPDEKVFFMDLLNNIGPESRLRFNRRYDVKGDDGHLMCWQDWTLPSYLPAPRKFHSFDALVKFIVTIPKLVTLKSGEWAPAQGQFSSWGDPESEGTLWWLARMRAAFDTIEWRPFASIDPKHVPALADDVIQLARAYRTSIRKRADALLGDVSATTGVYRDLSEACWLVPREQVSNDMWWALYRQ